MDALKIYLLVLIVCIGICFTTSKNCNVLLKYLAHTQQLYIYCTTTHAVPFKLCTACAPKYTEMVKAYDAVRLNCSSHYFNHDRVNVVETTGKNLQDLWDKGFCNDCLNSNHSDVFDEKIATLTSCLKENKGEECNVCLLQYLDLNSFYVSINEHNNGKVCFDLQDSMNITRILWSKTLNCCKHKVRLTWFAVAASFFGALPVAFYIGAVILTKRRERNNPILQFNEAPSRSLEQRAAPTTAAAPVEHNIENAPKPVIKSTLLQESDSDDDDLTYLQKAK